jgi:hypothetical protein
MKHFLTLLLLIPLGIKAQDSTLITNLQLRGGTIKIVSALMFGTPDTSVTNTFNKWRNDYIDGSPPNDNANVTISISKTTTVSYIYGLLLQIPAGVTEVEDILGDFKTSIAPKRATNTYLDRLCDDQENKFITYLSTLKNIGFKLLSSQ